MSAAHTQSVVMRCTRLAEAPSVPPPPGYRLRGYQPGDEAAWVEIHRLADLHNPASSALFEQQFAEARAELPQRQFYLLDPSGTPVGTATAWFGHRTPGGPPVGRVHWVAIVPREQGRGLSKPLLSAVCSRLRDLGYREAYLTTSTLRVPALNLYVASHFLPDFETPFAEAPWAALLAAEAGPQGDLRPGLTRWLTTHLPPAGR